jgi:hypothetical protein
METTRLTTAITAGCLMLMGAPALTPAFELRWRSVDNGGGYSTGGAFELEGTIGQPDAGFASGGGFELTGGFWFEQPLGDCDASGNRRSGRLRRPCRLPVGARRRTVDRLPLLRLRRRRRQRPGGLLRISSRLPTVSSGRASGRAFAVPRIEGGALIPTAGSATMCNGLLNPVRRLQNLESATASYPAENTAYPVGMAQPDPKGYLLLGD